MSAWQGKTRGGVLGYKIFILIIKYSGLSFAYFLLYFVVAYFMVASSGAFKWIFKFYHLTLGKNKIKSFFCVYRNYYLFANLRTTPEFSSLLSAAKQCRDNFLAERTRGPH